MIKSKLISFVKKPETLTIAFLVVSIGFIYREVIFNNKIAFPSNFLMSFYSPWTTQKLPEYPNGIPHKPIGGNDQIRMFYPYRTFINESFKHGELPLWNPYNFSGSPILANFQSAIFYPLNALYFLLPQITAWSILTLIQPILGTWFMYLYLRNHISQKSAALVGAISFGFSGFLITWSQENAVVGHSSLWLPLILYSMEKLLNSRQGKFFVLLIFSLVSCLLGGHYQFSFYMLFLSFIYAICLVYSHIDNRRINTLYIIGAYILMLGIAAIQLVPSIEAFTQSPRSSTSSASVVTNYLLPVTHFINALVPDIYGNPGSYNYFGRGFYQEIVLYAGIIPAIFAAVALFKWKSNFYVRFFGITLFLTYFLSVNTPVTQFLFNLPIPILSTFTPSRILILTSSAISVLAAWGYKYWLEDSKATRKTLYITAAVFSVIIVSWDALLFLTAKTNNSNLLSVINYAVRDMKQLPLSNTMISLKNSIIPLAMIVFTALIVFIQPRFTKASLALVAAVYLGQLYFLNKYLVVGERAFLYPQHFIFSDIQKHQNSPDRFLSFGLPILGNVALDKKVYSPDGIDPVFQSRYGQLIYASKNNGKYTKNIPRIEANLSEYAENKNIINNTYLSRLISLLSVTRVYNYETAYKTKEDIEKIFPSSQFVKEWSREEWQSYQNKTSVPRAFLAENYIVEKDSQKIIDKIFDPTINLSKTIILEDTPKNIKDENTLGESKVEIQKYKNQEVQIKVSTDKDRLLFLSDNFYPGWKAYINSKETKIYRANYTFRAVVVPKGTHTVAYKFEPISLQIGAAISGISLLVISLVLATPFFNRRQK